MNQPKNNNPKESYWSPFPCKPYYKKHGEPYLYQAYRFLGGNKPYPFNIIIQDSKFTFRGFPVMTFCLPVDKGYETVNVGDYIMKVEGGRPYVQTAKEFSTNYRPFTEEEYHYDNKD